MASKTPDLHYRPLAATSRQRPINCITAVTIKMNAITDLARAALAHSADTAAPTPLFGLPDQAPHEKMLLAADAESGLKAIVAIHSTARGPAFGGCRLWTYDNELAALNDALRLSQGMSLKNALADLPFGGGKAVIIKPAGSFDRPALFAAFGRAVQSLQGDYITAEDVGTSPEDMAYVAKKTSYVAGLGASGDPSPFTALGCFVGAQAAIKHHLQRDSFEGLTVAVQGLGHVGYDYARRLREAGAKLVVADIEPLKNIYRRILEQLDAQAQV